MLGFTFFWILFKISISFPAAKKVFKNSSSQQTFILTEGTWTFSLLFFLSITMQTSEFRNPFTISSEYFDMVCYCERPILVLSLLRFREMTSEHCGKKIVNFGIDWYCSQILWPKAIEQCQTLVCELGGCQLLKLPCSCKKFVCYNKKLQFFA